MCKLHCLVHSSTRSVIDVKLFVQAPKRSLWKMFNGFDRFTMKWYETFTWSQCFSCLMGLWLKLFEYPLSLLMFGSKKFLHHPEWCELDGVYRWHQASASIPCQIPLSAAWVSSFINAATRIKSFLRSQFIKLSWEVLCDCRKEKVGSSRCLGLRIGAVENWQNCNIGSRSVRWKSLHKSHRDANRKAS